MASETTPPPKQPSADRSWQQSRRRKCSLWSRLSAAVDAVFETGQLLDADGTARMQSPSGDSDLAAKTEFAAVGKLRRGVVQHDRGIDFAQEFLGRRTIFRDDGIRVM